MQKRERKRERDMRLNIRIAFTEDKIKYIYV